MAWVEPKGDKYRGCYYDATGRRRRTPVAATAKAARRLALDQEAKVRADTWVDPSLGRITLAAYVEQSETGWLAMRRGERTTKDTNLSLWRSVKPRMGHLELKRIRPSVVQAWINDMELEGVAPKTIHNRFAFLQAVLAAKKGASAVRDGLLERNPCQGVDLPHVPRRAVTIYQPEETDALLEAIPAYWRSLPLFASETGLRWGELMGITVADFELDHRAVLVTRTIVQTTVKNTGNGTPFMWKAWPKGKKPRRVALTPGAREAIIELVAERGLTRADRIFSMPDHLARARRVRPDTQDVPVPASPEFAAANGRSYRHGTVNGYQTGGCRCAQCRQASADYRYSRLHRVTPPTTVSTRRTAAWPVGVPIDRGWFRNAVWLPAHLSRGLQVRRFHDLRASHVSWLLAMGVDLPTVMERVGHEDFNTTLRYSKALSDADEKVMAALIGLRRRTT